jgi:hypothetical protein
MKKNYYSNQVVLDFKVFQQLIELASTTTEAETVIKAKIMRHARKFNINLRPDNDALLKSQRETYRCKRNAVLGLNDRHGKIVFLRNTNSEDLEPYTTFTPMLLVGKDHKDKLRFRLRGLIYPGLTGGLKTASCPIDEISRTVPEGFVYWTSGTYKNQFTATHPRRDVYKTLAQYLAQWAEHLR